MVLRVGSTYHLYYSGFKVGDSPGAYDTGHATSPDGTVWTKDSNNPVLVGGTDPTQCGFYQAAEPGVVFNPVDSTFYAYHVTARDRGPQYAGTDLALQQGIAVATSADGSTFTFQQMSLTQSAAYPVAMSYVGYSTPFALIDSAGTFHLFYDVAQYAGPGDWRQVALAHATSTDGLTFTEVETDTFVFQDVPWRTHEVRAPCVIEENDIFKMWFAGSNSLFFQPGFTFDIGYATSDKVCR